MAGDGDGGGEKKERRQKEEQEGSARARSVTLSVVCRYVSASEAEVGRRKEDGRGAGGAGEADGRKDEREGSLTG